MTTTEFKPNNFDEVETDYWKDYNYWQTQETLTIWNEVSKLKTKNWIIDTADSFSSVDNSYSLFVANPDWAIFSLWIDWMIKTFKIWFYWNTLLAYETLETELKNWLWIDYEVNYISWTEYSISKTNWESIIKTSPNLVKNITLNNFDTISIIDIIIDWLTVSLNWLTHWWNSLTALNYLVTQLPSIYYTSVNSNILTIARIDWAVPVISKNLYNRYDYLLQTRSTSIFTSWDKVDFLQSTIDSSVFSYTYPWTSFSYTFINVPLWSQSWLNKYNIYWTILFDIIYWSLSGSYTKSAISSISTSWIDFWWYQATITKSWYTQIVWPDFKYKINWLWTEISWTQISIIENNHLADIVIATYTKISITLTLWVNNFFIPCAMNIKNIEITAVSSVWSSNWVRNYIDWNSCTSKYGTTTEFVNNYIFKTDNNNYWEIVSVRSNWFVINWNTNTSNKITYTCT